VTRKNKPQLVISLSRVMSFFFFGGGGMTAPWPPLDPPLSGLVNGSRKENERSGVRSVQRSGNGAVTGGDRGDCVTVSIFSSRGL